MTEPATWNPNTGNPNDPDPPFNPNSSPEYWSIATIDGHDEVSLHQQGWAVTTVGGSRYDLPPRRGSDMTTAYRPGQIHRRKVPDARPITLLMFMVGWDPATGQAPPDQLLQWNDNWDVLRRLVYRNHLAIDQRFRLIRRHFLTVPQFPTTRVDNQCIQGDPGVPPPGPRLLTAFGNAEMTGTMAPNMTGRFRAEFQLDLTMADPYFYGPQVVANVHTGSGSPGYLWNDGFDDTGPGYMELRINGPMDNPVITNLTTKPDSWVKYNGVIKAGEYVRLIVNKFACEMHRSNGSIENKIGLISNYGSRWWLSLLPGANKIQMIGGSGSSGDVDIIYRPPYV